MNDFDYDAMQKKRIAASARHRKGGSKSRKCTLPQDAMSAAELKRRNGEMSTFNLGKPMRWAEFKTMPDDLKVEYITGLREKYNASDVKVAKMMGVSPSWLFREIKRIGGNDGARRKMSEAQLTAWEEFLDSDMVKLDPLETVTPIESSEKDVEDNHPNEKNPGCAINSGILQFTGKAPDIAIALMKFLGDREYRISVEFEEMA